MTTFQASQHQFLTPLMILSSEMQQLQQLIILFVYQCLIFIILAQLPIKTSMSTNQSLISASKLQKQKHIYILNIYLNGTQCSGKTSLAHKLIHKKFESNTVPTTNQHYQCQFHVTNQQTIKLILWDFGGCEQYQKIRVSAIANKNINKLAIIVYDVCDMKSFQAVEKLVQQWNKNVQKQYTNSIVLVANKIDLQKTGKREVPVQLGFQFANRHHLIYTQCSAKAEVEQIFELAYYLKLAQTQKQSTVNAFIEQQLAVTDQLEKQCVDFYKFKENSSVRELWQTKLALILYKITKVLKKIDHSNSKSEISQFFAKSLSVLKNIIVEAEYLNELKKEQKMLYMLKNMITIPQNPNQQQQPQQQPEYLSTNTISSHKKTEGSLSKLHHLTINKINQLQSQLMSKIKQQNDQLTKQKLKIQKYFKQLSDLFQEENIISFMNVVNRSQQQNASDHEQIMSRSSSLEIVNNKSTFLRNSNNQQSQRSQSYKLLNNKSIKQEHFSSTRTQSQQISNNTEHIGLENQTKLMIRKIKQQYQEFCELERVTRQIGDIFYQFTQKIRNQYVEVLQAQNTSNLTKIQVFQNLVSFYINGNIEQMRNNQENPNKSLKSPEKYAENKVGDLSEQFLENYQKVLNQSLDLLQKLMKVIIVGLDQRRAIKIGRQNCQVLKYWVEKRKSQISQKEEKDSKKGFFARLFG